MTQGLTTVATIQAVEHDPTSGWFKVVTDGDDYSTKIREKADEALRLQGKRVRLWYDESTVTKPTQYGPRTYVNRYYDRAEEDGVGFGQTPAGEGFTPPAAAAEGFAASTPRGEDPARNWRICLQTGGKLAVATLPLMPNEQRSFEVQKQIALAWGKFFFFTPVPLPMEGTTVPPTPQAAFDDQPAPWSDAPPDMNEPRPDDIPW